jgi:hypothetical protein
VISISRWSRISIGTWTVIAVYVVLKLAQWVLSLPTIVGPDSHSFLPGPGLAVPPDSNWYIGFEKVSFTGDGILRPWTVALPYALLLTDYLRSLFQLLVSMAVFLLLAFTMIRTCRNAWLGRALAMIVLIFSCTTLVSSWDMLLNGESMAISLTVLFISLAFLSRAYQSYRFLLLVILSGMLLLMTRPTLALLVILVLAVLILRRVRRDTSGPQAVRHVDWGRVVRGLVAVVLVVLAVLYPVTFAVRMDASWAGWYQQTRSETQFGYVVSDNNPKAETLKADLALAEAPECLLKQIPVDTSDYVGAPWGFTAHVRDTCPEFAAWFQKNWPAWYYRYIAVHPSYVAKVGISGLPIAMRPWDATNSFSPLPAPVRDALFPVTTSDGTSVYDPVVLYWGLAFSIVLVGLLAFRRRSWQFLRERWLEVALTTAVVLGSLLSILVNLLLIPSYPLETNRINVSTALAIRMAGTLVAVYLTWHLVALISRDRKRPRAQGDDLGRQTTTSSDS